MSEKFNDSHEVRAAKSSGLKDGLTSDRLVFLEEFPAVPAYAESLPDGLIEDEI